MSILDKRSFEDFKKYLEENASSKLLEKFKGGELKCIFKPLSTDASMWANKTGPNMVEIGGAHPSLMINIKKNALIFNSG